MTFTKSGIDAIKNKERLGAIKDKAQGMIKNNMFRTAKTAKEDLDAVGEEIKKDPRKPGRPATPAATRASPPECARPPSVLSRDQLTPRLYRMRQNFPHYFKQ